jgi:hypothetical protein
MRRTLELEIDIVNSVRELAAGREKPEEGVGNGGPASDPRVQRVENRARARLDLGNGERAAVHEHDNEARARRDDGALERGKELALRLGQRQIVPVELFALERLVEAEDGDHGIGAPRRGHGGRKQPRVARGNVGALRKDGARRVHLQRAEN